RGVSLDDAALSRVVVEPPRDESHGDMATNAALVLSKPFKGKPRDIAEGLAAKLDAAETVTSAEVAGPGFVNLRLPASAWHGVVSAVLADPESYGATDIGAGRKVNVEYVSTNPTGPMHIGHCRGAVVGDAIAALMERAGYSVTREYYINDAGNQIIAFAKTAHMRYREALGEKIGEIPEGLYPGDYMVPIGQKLVEAYGDRLLDVSEGEWLPVVSEFAVAAMMDVIRSDLALLRISHDVFFSERSLRAPEDKVARTIEMLRAKDLVYVGRLDPPKGELPDDWEDREQTLFRSTEFGDDQDRALLKSDGSYTYFAFDIAYHLDKFERGFAEMIDVWGADHAGYVKRLQAAVTASTGGEGALEVRLCQLVRLYRDGEPFKMSKRAGTFVTLRDVVEEVGPDATRFTMLTRKSDAPLDFDFVKVKEQSRDNPVFYVQYAHARTASIFRNAEEAGITRPAPGADLSRLDSEEELRLVRSVAQFPRIVEAAALAREPHRIAFYLNDLAATFHALWNAGKDSPHLRFIHTDDAGLTAARLSLVGAAQETLASGLRLLGVEPAEEMR
ncbi:MAG: arginine--tRNA ligase, partial [Pseudomonadota bacterium]